MAKGSVRKKGKKWYYRFYVEDASGKMVQKEYAGTESKSETEKLLRKALEDYENKKFVAKADSLTVGELLDMWAEEELKTGTLSNGTEKYHYPSDCHRRNRGNLLPIPGVLAVLQCRSHGVPDKVAKIIRIKVLVNGLFSCQNTSERADLFVARN